MYASSPSVLPLLASLAARRSAPGSGQAPPAPSDAPAVKHAERRRPQKVKQAKKGAPLEVSSRKPVAPPIGAGGLTKKGLGAGKARDPRFDDYSGKLDMDLFSKSYAFLEDYRSAELETLKKDANKLDKLRRKKKKAPGVDEAAEAVSQEVRLRTQQDKQRRRLGEIREATQSLNAEERAKVRLTGKAVFHHKAGHVRKLLKEKRTAAKKGGRDHESEKRERKMAAREKKRLPERRRNIE